LSVPHPASPLPPDQTKGSTSGNPEKQIQQAECPGSNRKLGQLLRQGGQTGDPDGENRAPPAFPAPPDPEYIIDQAEKNPVEEEMTKEIVPRDQPQQSDGQPVRIGQQDDHQKKKEKEDEIDSGPSGPADCS